MFVNADPNYNVIYADSGSEGRISNVGHILLSVFDEGIFSISKNHFITRTIEAITLI